MNILDDPYRYSKIIEMLHRFFFAFHVSRCKSNVNFPNTIVIQSLAMDRV